MSLALEFTAARPRLALDTLRSARVRRETYVVSWLPEPVVEALDDPAERVTLDDTVSWALLVALESLSPAECTAWVLHDLFGMPFDEVGSVVGRTPAAVRQLASRARRHVADGAPRLAVASSEHDRVVTAFLAAAAGGDLGALVTVLDPDVVLTSDGGVVVSAARRPVFGADRVSRFLVGIGKKVLPGRSMVLLRVNGALGLGMVEDGLLVTVMSFVVSGGAVARIDLVRAPAKLGRG